MTFFNLALGLGPEAPAAAPAGAAPPESSERAAPQREVDAALTACEALDAEVEKARRALGAASERVAAAARVVAVGNVERLAADLDLAIRTAISLRALMLGADFLPRHRGVVRVCR